MVKKRWSVRSRKGWQRWKGIAPGLPPSLVSLGSKTSRFTQRRVCHRLIATRYQLQILCPELLEQLLTEIATIAEQLAPQRANELPHRTTVVHIARRERESQQFALLVDDQVQLKAIEPAQASFASSCESGKDFVRGNAAVVAEPDPRCLHI